jgi:hypothetical protein
MLSVVAPLLAMNLLSYIPWSCIFLITQFFGVRLYYLKKRDECTRIQKRVQKWCSHTTDGGKGYGYAIGYWYVLNISVMSGECSDSYTVYMVATEASFEALTKDLNDDDEEDESPLLKNCGNPDTPQKTIPIWGRHGSFQNPWLRKREIPAEEVARGQQEEVITKIVEHYKKKRHTVAYIHGPPGTGKSMIGTLLAERLNGSICNTLKPWQPNDTFDMLYSEVEPTKNKPVILIFDEVDAALLKIHAGIPPHPKYPTMVLDKEGWNGMLDEVQRNMYPNFILLMTSNRGPDFVNSLDLSYMREGRIDLVFEMTESLLKN